MDDERAAIFEALGHRYRRNILTLMQGHDSPIAVADLAMDLAAMEEASPDEIHQRLHHIHLPKLESLNIITYDRDQRVVSLVDEGESVSTILERLREIETDRE